MNLKKNNFNDIYYELIEGLHTRPEHTIKNKSGDTIHEIVNCSFELSNPKHCFATIRDMSLDYLKGELDFYLKGSPFLVDIMKHSKFWEKCSDDGRTINSNYGKILLHDRNYNNYTQFEYAKDMLLRNIHSKKSVMVIYNKENSRISKDNPCTMYMQYLIRDNKLSVYVKMRSSDIWFGLPYDVPFFVYMLYRMYYELKKEKYKDLEIGIYSHQSGSLHLYERNISEVVEIVSYQQRVEPEGLQEVLFFKHIKSRLWKDEMKVNKHLRGLLSSNL